MTLGPGWVKEFCPEADGFHLILTTYDPITRQDTDVRVSRTELEAMLATVPEPSQHERLARRIGLEVGQSREVAANGKRYKMVREE